MMTYDPQKRITAIEALKDPWIINNLNKPIASTNQIQISLDNLQSFSAYSLLHKTILVYFAQRTITKKKEKNLRAVFGALDKNADGQLSKEELLEAYIELCNGNIMLAKKEVERIMTKVDFNQNGFLDYNGNFYLFFVEFLLANLKKKSQLSTKKLRYAFDFFDQVYNIGIFLGQKWLYKQAGNNASIRICTK